ncbi:MAG: bifunctional salicylyl-CoA 5-hydroxylase/oxidoreductase [Vicinamibacteria bacterium]
MRIVSVGGGPAGLYFAILAKRQDPACEVLVLERNRPDDTFGWGVVFSDETLSHFAAADAETHDEIRRRFAYWTDIEILFEGERLRSTGHGFCGISRRVFLEILQRRAAGLGVEIRYETEVADVDALRREFDLVLAADGANSRSREAHAPHFGTTIDWRRCRFSWLGLDRRLPAFSFVFKRSPHGLFQVHAYPFDERASTFIVECREEVWRRAGLDRADEAATIAFLSELFREELEGARLLANRSVWRAFPTISNRRWRLDNLVLAGDAARTAHFSIGSGTKLAMEDAIALAAAIGREPDLGRALDAYEAERQPEAARLQRAAQTSLEWFESSARYLGLPPLAFAFSLLSRSKRITWDNLARRDPALVAAVAQDFARRNPHRDARVAVPADAPFAPAAASPAPAAPPAFQPFRLRGLTLANRIVVSPMCQYSSQDGLPNDWHLVHLGSRAVGGAGLVMTEATAVSRDGRISPGCAGIYEPEHASAWRRVVDFVHAHSRARIGIQLAHAGRKASSARPWEGGLPLREGAWPTLAPSPLAFDAGWPVPREMTRADMDRVRDAFERGARRAAEAGFDLVELHMAHGYLLASFLSPLTNRRQDGYGGDLAGRARYPLEVFDAVRAAWPAEKPISVRISATDWAEGGFSSADRVGFARLLKQHGCDVVDVSAGGTVPDQVPVYGRMFQVPFSDEIRNEAGIPTMAVGNIQDADQCHTILAAGRADLVVLARGHLADPYFTLHAAAAYGHDEQYWPPQYLRARPAARKG